MSDAQSEFDWDHLSDSEWNTKLDVLIAQFNEGRGELKLPVPIHEVDYEEIVTNLESVARGLVAACGLPWEAACLEFHRNERPIRTASVMQVRQPIYGSSVARWKHYESAFPDLFNLLSGHSGVLEATQGA